MMRSRVALVAGLLAGAAAGTLLLTVVGRADAPIPGCAGDENKADIASGEGTIAISDREIVVVGNRKSGCWYMRPALDTGLLRHLAVQKGTGTAYVDDQPGGDRLVMVTPRGTVDVPSESEITHPSWSPEGDLAWAVDFQSLRVKSEESVKTVDGPKRARAVFSPTFASESELVVVGQESVPGAPGYEDDQLNNLWTLDLATERWSKVTDFGADSDRWSIVRTPLALDDGRVMFVRATGRASMTRAPLFELWELADGSARKVRDLPGEMFLAGTRGGRLMWNVFSDRCGDWELLVESRSGMRSLGCGAVLVDPVNLPDPDLLVEDDHAEETLEKAPVDMGVVVGDFSSRSEAAMVAKKVGAGAGIISNEDAPLAVRPGAYAVALPIPEGASSGVALESVRATIPGLRSKTFLAPLSAP